MRKERSPKKPAISQQSSAITGGLRFDVGEHPLDWQWEEALLAAILRDLERRVDPRSGAEREPVADERRRLVRKLIDEMSPKDRSLLKAVFLEERERDIVCQEFGVGREYLRALIYRTKVRLRELGVQAQAAQLDMDLIVDRATAVIGDRTEAMRWLGTPVRALGYATPISLLGTSEGAARVEDLLGQIEHGVW